MQDSDGGRIAGRHAPAARIGVFDSGVGGLSVLRAVRAALPTTQLMYVADAAHAPYGERDQAFIVARAHALTNHLLARGAGMVVVACNTATAAAVASLRQRHPGVRFVGVEPGLKPAARASRCGRVAVLVTPATAASERYQRLCAHIEADAAAQRPAGPRLSFITMPCPGLASAIERGAAHRADLDTLLAQLLQPLEGSGIDTAVLGCTHYPLAADEIQAALGRSVTLIDTAAAVAAQVHRLASPLSGLRPQDAHATPTFWSTGNTNPLRAAITRWIAPDCHVEQLAV